MSLTLPEHIDRLRTACPIMQDHHIRQARKHGLRRIVVKDVTIIERKVKS